MTSEPHVVIRGVSKHFGQLRAVDSLSLEVEKGSFTTLLGPSGCGKTTTLRMLAGFYDPDVGQILIDGQDQRGLPPYRRSTSIVFQDYALFPHMTVFDNLAYGLRLKKTTPAERKKRVGRVMDFLGLLPLERRYPHELSGGQQQRVALGRSLVIEPSVILMDEPLSNLDAKLRTRVRSELKEIQRTLGVTTIYVTHDQDEALSLSDKVAVLEGGQLQQYTDPWELYHEPANRFVADFVGQANFLPAEIRAHDAAAHEVEAEVLGQRIRCRFSGSSLPGNPVLLVRPEWLELQPGESTGRPPAGLHLSGRVWARDFLGSILRIWLEVDGLEDAVMVDLPASANQRARVGAPLSVRVAADVAVLLEGRNH